MKQLSLDMFQISLWHMPQPLLSSLLTTEYLVMVRSNQYNELIVTSSKKIKENKEIKWKEVSQLY